MLHFDQWALVCRLAALAQQNPTVAVLELDPEVQPTLPLQLEKASSSSLSPSPRTTAASAGGAPAGPVPGAAPQVRPRHGGACSVHQTLRKNITTSRTFVFLDAPVMKINACRGSCLQNEHVAMCTSFFLLSVATAQNACHGLSCARLRRGRGDCVRQRDYFVISCVSS